MLDIQKHDAQDSGKPLTGMLVVSLEQAVAGPLCTCRLADAGARVIKIERPEGDFARGYDRAALGDSSYFAWANRGKESVVLDYKNPDDSALLHRLMEQADIVVQNMAPGSLDRAGFGSAALRERYPSLITCDISGYGTDNAATHLKAYDFLVQCESGLVAVSGSPAGYGRIGVSICDIGAGMNAAIGVLSAVALRYRTGRGSGVSVSLFGSAADWMNIPYLHTRYGKGAPERVGLMHPSIAPYGAYGTKDGATIVIGIQNEREWVRFCEKVLGSGDIARDERFCSNNLRVANRPALDELIAGVFATLDLDQARQSLGAADIAFGQLRSVSELAEHPALRTRTMQVSGGTIEMIASAVDAPWDDEEMAQAPAIGQHTDAIRREFSA